MRGLASFILRGQSQAVLVVVATALVPLLNLFSGAALALVTLRKGPGEGLVVVLMSLCLAGFLLWWLAGSMTPASALFGLFWLPIWVLAVTLRYTVSLARTLQLALLLAGLVLLGCLAWLDDPLAWGRALLQKAFQPLLRSLQLPEAEQAAALGHLQDTVAPLILGLLLANGLLSIVLSLLLGRWWQALLFNPGGFQAEFHGLRLGRQTALLAAAVFALALLTRAALFANLALLLAAVYALQGIALVHGVVGRARLSPGWLIVFYVLMVFALPQLLALLCLLGIVDAWLDFRARFKAGTP